MNATKSNKLYRTKYFHASWKMEKW